MSDQPLPTPTNVVARAYGLTKGYVNWTDAAGGLAENYRVDRGVPPYGGGDWTMLVDTLGSTIISYVDDGPLDPHALHKYRVQALSTGAAEVFTITCAADVAGSLSGKYFDYTDAAGRHRVWFDVASGSTAPTSAGVDDLLEINIAADASADTIAAALDTAIDGANIAVTGSGPSRTFTSQFDGAYLDVADVNTGFTFNTTVQGKDIESDPGVSNEFYTPPQATGLYYATIPGSESAYAYVARIRETSPYQAIDLFPIASGKTAKSNQLVDAVYFGPKISSPMIPTSLYG